MLGWILAAAALCLPLLAEQRYRIDLDAVPRPADWAAFHAWHVRVRAPFGFAPRLRDFRFEARLTGADRGLSIPPRVTRISAGGFVVEPVRFDLPGEWRIEAKVRDDEGWESATRVVRAGDAALAGKLRAIRPQRGSRFDRYAEAVLNASEPAPGSRLTEAEQAGLRVYLSDAASCFGCHRAAPKSNRLPRRHATDLTERDRADVEAFLETLQPSAPLQ